MENKPALSVPRCPRCTIGQEGCKVGTPLSEVREDGVSRIVCLKCGWRPKQADKPDTIKGPDEHADITGGTNEPEREYPY